MSTLRTNWSARPLQPMLLPHERKALCAEGSATRRFLQSQRETRPPRSGIAVCFFGMLARRHKAGTGACRAYSEEDSQCAEDLHLTSHVALPSFRQRVLDVNPHRIDIFLHTWGTKHSDTLRNIYAPRAAAFGVKALAGKRVAPATMWWGWPAGSAPGMPG